MNLSVTQTLFCQIKKKMSGQQRKCPVKNLKEKKKESRLPGSLINALTSMLGFEETDHNFIHSMHKPTQKIRKLLGIKVSLPSVRSFERPKAISIGKWPISGSNNCCPLKLSFVSIPKCRLACTGYVIIGMCACNVTCQSYII